MFELTQEQINKVNLLIREGEEFRGWLDYIGNTIVAKYEAAEVTKKKELFSNFIETKTDTVWQEQGELEFLLGVILECTYKGEAKGVKNIIALLLGRYWERVFCREFTFQTRRRGYVYRFQKHQKLGVSRFAYGSDTVETEHIRTPDVLFVFESKWVMGEIKHIRENEEHCYYMSQADYNMDVDLTKISPDIPMWFIVHDYGKRKWTRKNNPDDWRVGDFAKLGAPTVREITPSPIHFRGGKKQPMCCWHKDQFISLEEAIGSLRHAKKTVS